MTVSVIILLLVISHTFSTTFQDVLDSGIKQTTTISTTQTRTTLRPSDYCARWDMECKIKEECPGFLDKEFFLRRMKSGSDERKQLQQKLGNLVCNKNEKKVCCARELPKTPANTADYCGRWSMECKIKEECPGYLDKEVLLRQMKSGSDERKQLLQKLGNLVCTTNEKKVCCARELPVSPYNTTVILTIGGETSDGFTRKANFLGQESCTIPSLPNYRSSPTSFRTADDKILTCGGDVWTMDSTSCLVLDLATKAWKPHSTLTVPRSGATAVSLPSGVYILGGSDQVTSSEFLATGATSWMIGPDIPVGSDPGWYSCSVPSSSTSFVMVMASYGLYDGPIAEYDIIAKKWTTLGNLKRSKVGMNCVLVGEKLIIAGGWSSQSSHTDTFIFDMQTKTVREVGRLKQARAYFGLSTVKHGLKEEVLAYGGKDDLFSYLFSNVLFRGRGLVEVWNDDDETWEIYSDTSMKDKNLFGYVVVPYNLVCPK